MSKPIVFSKKVPILGIYTNWPKFDRMRLLNVTLLLLFVALQAHIWIGEGSVGHIVALQHKIDTQQETNARLKARNDVLAAEVVDLQNGYETIEAYARTELGMVKPGETFFLVINEKQ